MLNNKKLEFFLSFVLVISAFFVFTKNFYNEILLRYIENPQFFQVFFSDFFLVHKGSEFLLNNKNPYLEWLNINKMPFFNPPIVFQVFKFLGDIDYYKIAKIWLLITSIALLSIPLLFKKIYKLEFKSILIFFISFGGISISVFLTGNISIFLSFFFVLAIYFLNKKNDYAYYFIISILSIIKFPYLIFFTLPILIRKIEIRVFKQILAHLIFVTLIYLIFFYLDKDLFLSWVQSLEVSKTIGDKGDLGRGLFRIISNIFSVDNPLNIFFYIIIVTSLLFFLYFIFKKSEFLNDKKNEGVIIAFCIIFLTDFHTRLKSYDLLVVIPSLFFIIQSLQLKASIIANYIFKFLLLFALICWTSPYAPICLIFLLIVLFSFDLKLNFLERKKNL